MIKYIDYNDSLLNLIYSFINYNTKPNSAIVFDIDDTLIFWKNSKINKPLKKIYDLALKRGIAIFIITARLENHTNINYTINQLKNKGFGNYNRLYLMPYKYLQERKVGLYKYNVRNLINKKYKIICNFGDQWTDFYINRNISNLNNYIVLIIENNLLSLKLKNV